MATIARLTARNSSVGKALLSIGPTRPAAGFYGLTAILAKARPAPPDNTENDLELLFFEDLPLGAEWTTRRRTLSEADLASFTGVVGDFNPLHVDVEYARHSHFGGVIVHAGLIASAAIGLGSMDAPLPATVGMLGMSWKFLKPVRVGDSISSRWRLARKRQVENPAWGLAVWQIEVLNQKSEAVATGEVSRLVARRERRGPARPAVAAPDGAVAAAESAIPLRRRTATRRSVPAAAAAEIAISDPAPDSLPADAPAASRRRRRRRGSGSGASGTGDPVVAAPAPLSGDAASGVVGAGAAGSSSSGRRRRRRRSAGSNGSGSNQLGAGERSDEASAGRFGPAGGSDPASLPAPVAAPSGPAQPAKRLGFLRRLRGG